MSYRLAYTVEASGSTRLEMECDAAGTDDVTLLYFRAEQVFLAALDRLPKVGPVNSRIKVHDDLPDMSVREAAESFVTCFNPEHPGDPHRLGSQRGTCTSPRIVSP